MKQTIALILLMLIFLTGCGRTPVETEPVTAPPAQSKEFVMPNVIGMDWEEAKELLDRLGISYACDSEIDTDQVPEGAVAHSYPSAGAIFSADTVAVIARETDAEPIPEEIVTIDYAPEDYSLHPENYEEYLFADLEFGVDAIVTPMETVYGFRFYLLDSNIIFDGKFEIVEEYFTCEKLTPEKPFVTRIHIVGPGGPYYGISFVDEAGNNHHYVIYETGIDRLVFALYEYTP